MGEVTFIAYLWYALEERIGEQRRMGSRLLALFDLQSSTIFVFANKYFN